MARCRIFVSEEFDGFARKARISDESLIKAVSEIESGLISADLGGNLIKQRIARKGEGKSGGFRTLIIFKNGDRAIFVQGFAKNVKADLAPQEANVLKVLAKDLLDLSDQQLEMAVTSNALRRIERIEDRENE